MNIHEKNMSNDATKFIVDLMDEHKKKPIAQMPADVHPDDDECVI